MPRLHASSERTTIITTPPFPLHVELGAIGQVPSALGLVDEESGILWPNDVEDAIFLCFLDNFGVLLDTRPSTIDLDEAQIEQDVGFIYYSIRYLTVGLQRSIEKWHPEIVDTRLKSSRTTGFETFPRFRELVQADRGALPHFQPGFQYNWGKGNFLHSQARLPRAAICHQYVKLHRYPRQW